MKVRVTLTLDIDPEAWDMSYGTGTGAKAVREDVQAFAVHVLSEQMRDLGVLRGA